MWIGERLFPNENIFMKKKNLTLVEVVVVVALTALLAFLVAFGLKWAREDAKRISCSNNMKQIGLGMCMYSNVYMDAFPDQNGRGGLQMLAKDGFLE